MIDLNEDNFFQVVNGSNLILVDFWAAWCGPCKTMLPILEEIDSEGKVLIGKLNVDENPKKSAEFSIVSIPTMILFKSGQAVHTVIGAKPKHVLLKEIEPWM